VYVVSASELFFVSTDTFSSSADLLSGSILAQAGGRIPLSSLLGTSVVNVTGLSTTTSSDGGAGLLVFARPRTLVETLDENDNGTIVSVPSGTGTLQHIVRHRGPRHTDPERQHVRILIWWERQGFLQMHGSKVRTGLFEQQAGAPFNVAALVASFIEGSSGNAYQRIDI